MKVFLSWSGERSKLVAEAVRDWLPLMIQAVEPWISSVDMRKGSRWSQEISGRLEETKVGIVCLASDNLTEPWMLFEAGALSKTKDARLCTFLLDVKPTDIEGPLAQFQHTVATKGDTRQLIGTINESVKQANEKALDEKALDEMFGLLWPKLEKELEKARLPVAAEAKELRGDREVLNEILELVRDSGRRGYLTFDSEAYIPLGQESLYGLAARG